MFTRKDKFPDYLESPEEPLASPHAPGGLTGQQQMSINYWLGRTTKAWGNAVTGAKRDERKAVYKIVTDRNILNATTVNDYWYALNGLTEGLKTTKTPKQKYDGYQNLNDNVINILDKYKTLFSYLHDMGSIAHVLTDLEITRLFGLADPKRIGAEQFRKIMVFITTKDLAFFENFKKNIEAFKLANPTHPLIDRLDNLVSECQFSVDHQTDIAIKNHWNKIDAKSEATAADKIRDDVFDMVHDPIVIRSLKPDSSTSQSADTYAILFDDLKSKFQSRYTKGHKHGKVVNEALDSYYSMYTMLNGMATIKAGEPGSISAMSIASLYELKAKIGDANFDQALGLFLEKFPNIAAGLNQKLYQSQETITENIDNQLDAVKKATDTANYNAFAQKVDKAVEIRNKKAELLKEFTEFAKNRTPNDPDALNGINAKLQELIDLGVSNQFIINTLKGGIGTFLAVKDDAGKPIALTNVHFTVLQRNFAAEVPATRRAPKIDAGRGYEAIEAIAGIDPTDLAKVPGLFNDVIAIRNFDDVLDHTTIFDISPAAANKATDKRDEIKTALTKDFLFPAGIYLSIKDDDRLAIPDIGDQTHFKDLTEHSGDGARLEWQEYVIKLVNLTNVLGSQPQVGGILYQDLIAKFATKFNDITQAKSELQAVIDLFSNPDFLKRIPDPQSVENQNAVNAIAKVIVSAAKARQVEVEQEKTHAALAKAVKDIGEFAGINEFAGVGVGDPSLLINFGIIADALKTDYDATMRFLNDNVGLTNGLPAHDYVKPIVTNAVSEKVNDAEQECLQEAKKLDAQAKAFKAQVDKLIQAAIDQKIEGAPANLAAFYAALPNAYNAYPFLDKLKELADTTTLFLNYSAEALHESQPIAGGEAANAKKLRADIVQGHFTNALQELANATVAKRDLDVMASDLKTFAPTQASIRDVADDFLPLLASFSATSRTGREVSGYKRTGTYAVNNVWDRNNILFAGTNWKKDIELQLGEYDRRLQEFNTALTNFRDGTITAEVIQRQFQELSTYFHEQTTTGEHVQRMRHFISSNSNTRQQEEPVLIAFQSTLENLNRELVKIGQSLDTINSKSQRSQDAVLGALGVNFTIPAAPELADQAKADQFATAAEENRVAHANTAPAKTTGLDSFEIQNADGTLSVNVCYTSLVQLLLKPISPSQEDVDKRINALFTVFRSLLLKADPNLSAADQTQRFRHLVEKAAKQAIETAEKDDKLKSIEFADGSKKSHKDYLKDHFGGNGVIMQQHLDACGWICEQAGGKGLDPANRHISIDFYTAQTQTVTPVVVYIPKTYGINQEKPQRSIVMERSLIDPNTTVDVCLSADRTSCTFDSTKKDLVDYDLGAPVGVVKVKFNSGPTVVTRKDPTSGKTTFDTVFVCSTLEAKGGTGANRDLKDFQNTALLPIEAGGKKYYVEITLQTQDGSMSPVVYKRGDFTFRILERQGVAGGIGDVLRTIAVGSGLGDSGLELYSTNNSDISHIQSALDTKYDFNCVFSEHYKTNETGEIERATTRGDAAHTVVKPKTLTIKSGKIIRTDEPGITVRTDGIGSTVSSADVHYETVKHGWTILGSTPTLVFNSFSLQNTHDSELYDTRARGLTDRFLMRNMGRLANLTTLGSVSYFTPDHYNQLFVKKVLKSRGIDQKAFEKIVSEICTRGSEVSNYLGKGKKLNLALSQSNITDLRPLLALQTRLGQKDIGAVLGEIDLTGCDQLFKEPYRTNNIQVLRMLGVNITHENSVDALKDKILNIRGRLNAKSILESSALVELDFSNIKTLTKHEIRELAMFAIEQKMEGFVKFTKTKPYKGSDSIQRILFSINSSTIDGYGISTLFESVISSKGKGGDGLGRAIFEVLVNRHLGGHTKETAKALADKDFTYKDPLFGNESIQEALESLIEKCHKDCAAHPDNEKNIRREFSANVMEMLRKRGIVGEHQPDIYTKVASARWDDRKGELAYTDPKFIAGSIPEFLFIVDTQINEKTLDNIALMVQNGLKGISFSKSSCNLLGVDHNRLDIFCKQMKDHCPQFEMHGSKSLPSSHMHVSGIAQLKGRPVVKGVEGISTGR